MRTSTKYDIREGLSKWNWAAIAAGVVIALATQILLVWLGNAFAYSIGNKEPGGLYAVWVVIVQLGSLFIGAGFAAYLSRASSNAAGAAIGAFTWALALVLGSAVAKEPLAGWRPENIAAAAWTTFVGALLSLATAMLGGVTGSLRARRLLHSLSPDTIIEERVVTVSSPGTPFP